MVFRLPGSKMTFLKIGTLSMVGLHDHIDQIRLPEGRIHFLNPWTLAGSGLATKNCEAPSFETIGKPIRLKFCQACCVSLMILV